MPPRFSPHLVAEPPTIHRMASMLYGDPKPTMGDLTQGALASSVYGDSYPLTCLRNRDWPGDCPIPLEDARVVRVDLTDVGRRMHQDMETHAVQSAESILECLTPEEQMILLTLLQKVASNLKKKSGMS